MAADDPFDLARFVAAQAQNYPAALAELKTGAKRTHWIWYVFPQLRGLGQSEMAGRFGISGLDEARAYLMHPVLGPRLFEATAAAVGSAERDPRRLFGSPDAMKVRSSLTLFTHADPTADALKEALAHFYGAPDPQTLRLLGAVRGDGASGEPELPGLG